MRAFTAALGVQCGYCHVIEAGSATISPSDAKPPKKIARVMMQMTGPDQQMLAANIEKAGRQSDARPVRDLPSRPGDSRSSAATCAASSAGA